ncbi:MAG: ACP S-malonyltransferase [Flavobacteriales bacterium]|jgi:[acyl-carrier-protein] S-malonyltransferase
MTAYIFPGQGSQFPGMGQDLYENSSLARDRFEQANAILGFNITNILFEGSKEDLQQTSVTQPALFLHAVILREVMGDQFQPAMVAGHSLGEFSALTAAGALSFEDGLRLVRARATAMQEACELQPGSMTAVLGLEDAAVEKICSQHEGVVAANFNCPGQVVISGEKKALENISTALEAAGARRVVPLPVGGAFHSPLMEPARVSLAAAIEATTFSTPVCPVYQNVSAQAEQEAQKIKAQLIAQLTGAVRWTQTVEQMIADGAKEFIEVGPGKVLQGLVRKINREVAVGSAAV